MTALLIFYSTCFQTVQEHTDRHLDLGFVRLLSCFNCTHGFVNSKKNLNSKTWISENVQVLIRSKEGHVRVGIAKNSTL